MGQDDEVGQGPAADMMPPDPTPASRFARMQEEDKANEVRVLWSEVAVMALLALLVAIYLVVA
jgi:hypothetical protein